MAALNVRAGAAVSAKASQVHASELESLEEDIRFTTWLQARIKVRLWPTKLLLPGRRRFPSASETRRIFYYANTSSSNANSTSYAGGWSGSGLVRVGGVEVARRTGAKETMSDSVLAQFGPRGSDAEEGWGSLGNP
jgi:hypothetical protein